MVGAGITTGGGGVVLAGAGTVVDGAGAVVSLISMGTTLGAPPPAVARKTMTIRSTPRPTVMSSPVRHAPVTSTASYSLPPQC
ncbi:MAG: hypothetical protein H0T85_08740 [Geodermatophilaceae bacterium]|nr:hypothetical protein [Geodermatophilaceae bacterium]